MRTAFKTGYEISQIGFAALLDKLGPGGALQFIQQYEKGKGDYTRERKRFLAGKKMDEMWKEMQTSHSGR